MTMTDPIADMLTRIRNANSVHHDKVEIPCSKIKTAIAEILKSEGFIKDFEVVAGEHQNVIRVQLKYGPNKEKVISGIKRISKPGLEKSDGGFKSEGQSFADNRNSYYKIR